ncbi:hypothetical protein [Variovorax sp. RCC_210]|uniref:hypothetical protein n=1 Tax=Variovorax sp. RCC_210 TaxID=3239217 RepID=UPI001403234A
MKNRTKEEIGERSYLADWAVAMAVVAVLALFAFFHWLDRQGARPTGVRTNLIVRDAPAQAACGPVGFCASRPHQGDHRAPAF